MKTTLLIIFSIGVILIGITVVPSAIQPEIFTNTSVYNVTNDLSIRWQYDAIRVYNFKANQDLIRAEEFQKTNTNPMLVFNISHYPQKLMFSSDAVELGYKNDGTVHWRTPPELVK